MTTSQHLPLRMLVFSVRQCCERHIIRSEEIRRINWFKQLSEAYSYHIVGIQRATLGRNRLDSSDLRRVAAVVTLVLTALTAL